MHRDTPTLLVCVWCGQPNHTPLLLCETCEGRAVLMKQQRGEVVRTNG